MQSLTPEALNRPARLGAPHCGALWKLHTQSYSRPPSAAATSGCLIIPRFSVSQLQNKGDGQRQEIFPRGCNTHLGCACLPTCRDAHASPAAGKCTALHVPKSSVGLAIPPQLDVQVGLYRAAHAVQHHEVCARSRLCQLRADLRHGRGEGGGRTRACGRAALVAGRSCCRREGSGAGRTAAAFPSTGLQCTVASEQGRRAGDANALQIRASVGAGAASPVTWRTTQPAGRPARQAAAVPHL